MKFFVKLLVVLAIIGGIGWAASAPVQKYLRDRKKVNYRTATVKRGRLQSVVIATGEVQPVLRVQVGSFVSGPILEEPKLAEFNDVVRKGQLLAKIDPTLYDAAVARDRANLLNREAEVERVAAQLKRAENDLARAMALREENVDYISGTEMDRYKFEKLALEKQLSVARAAVKQAAAQLLTSEANLGYTNITSPVDGIVIDRKIDPGQTLAAQFQTPEMFVVAPNMRDEMHVFASIDETDIGRVREALAAQEKDENSRPVQLTVDAYPEDLFRGKIWQVRMSSTETQNVVTYPVVISVPNPDLKLLPGMTARLTFLVEEKQDVLKIPNAALRYFPDDEKQVRDEDKKLLEGVPVETSDQETDVELTATERAEAGRKRARRHVWVQEGDKLRAVEVVVGIDDNRFTELVEGELTKGQKLVVGIKPKK